jgi:hypothetical protein
LPVVYTAYKFSILAETTQGDDYEESVTLRSHMLPVEIRAGLIAPPNATVGWDVLDIKTAGFPAPLVAITNAADQAHRDAVNVMLNGTDPVTGTTKLVNFADPEGAGGGGDWCPDDAHVSNVVGVAEDNFVSLCRTVITIAEGEQGDYTFRIRGDDGYAIRITGATFTGKAGAAANVIDPTDPSTAGFLAPTGDTNAFLHCNFPAAGDYLVEFLNWELGGGFYQELAWAAGTHSNLNGTKDWFLVGDMSNYEGVSCWGVIPEAIIPPISSEGGWATHIWYDANTVNTLADTMNFLRGVGVGSTFSSEFIGDLPALNHSEGAVNAGRINPTLTYPGTPSADRVAMLSHAKIVSTADGLYTIQIRSDDGFLFRFADPMNQFSAINGNGILHPSALYEISHPAGTGDSNTRATVFLPAGEHDAYFVWWEGGGGSHFEITSMAGLQPIEGAPFTLLDPTPIPAGPLITGIGTTAAGWEVTSTVPGATDFVAGNGTLNADAAPFLDAVGATTNHDEINFTDPQSGGGGSALRNVVPWPGNTPADDNDYAMRGTAVLEITEAGVYAIGFQGDDATYLDIIGQPWDSIAESLVGAVLAERSPGSGTFDRMTFDAGTGNSRTVGLITLTVGQYPIEFGFVEDGGGSFVAIFGGKTDNYVPGVLMVPIGVNTAGETNQSAAGIHVGKSVAPTFEITAFTNDTGTEEISVTFTSNSGVNYAIDVTTSLASGEWGEASDAVGEAGSTLVSVSYANVIAGLALPNGSPIPENLFWRVRNVDIQPNANPIP